MEELGALNKRRTYTILDSRISSETNLIGLDVSSINANKDDILITIPENDNVFSSIYKFDEEWQYLTQLSFPTIQGDWNQTNQVALDFIKGKPNFESFINSVSDLSGKLDDVEDKIDNQMIVDLDTEFTENGLKLIGKKNGIQDSSIEIPFVSSSQTGIFRVEDYQNITNMLNWVVPGGMCRGIFSSWESVPAAWSSALWHGGNIYTGDYFIVKENDIGSLYIVTNNWKTDSTIGKSTLTPSFNFNIGYDIATETKAGLVKSSNEDMKINFTNGVGQVNNLPETPRIILVGSEVDIPISETPPNEDDGTIVWYVQLKEEE